MTGPTGSVLSRHWKALDSHGDAYLKSFGLRIPPSLHISQRDATRYNMPIPLIGAARTGPRGFSCSTVPPRGPACHADARRGPIPSEHLYANGVHVPPCLRSRHRPLGGEHEPGHQRTGADRTVRTPDRKASDRFGPGAVMGYGRVGGGRWNAGRHPRRSGPDHRVHCFRLRAHRVPSRDDRLDRRCGRLRADGVGHRPDRIDVGRRRPPRPTGDGAADRHRRLVGCARADRIAHLGAESQGHRSAGLRRSAHALGHPQAGDEPACGGRHNHQRGP